jgi:hypothetical protein
MSPGSHHHNTGGSNPERKRSPEPSSSSAKRTKSEGREVRFAIMTANDNEWEAAQYFLDDKDLPEGIKDDLRLIDLHQKKNDESLEPCCLTKDIQRYKAINVEGVHGVLLKCFNTGGGTRGGSKDTVTNFLKNVHTEQWPLKVIFVVGCCGAHSNEKRVPEGTIFVNELVLEYGRGKFEKDGTNFGRSHNHNTGDDNTVWLSVIDECKTRSKYYISSDHFKGVPFLSDDFVIKDEDTAAELHKVNAPAESVVGFEMEGSGVCSAVKSYSEKHEVKLPTVVLVKGVSDNADAKKKDLKDIVFFNETKTSVEENRRQKMCTIMSLTLVLRAIIKNKCNMKK